MKTVQDLMNTRSGEIFSINSSQTVYEALIMMAERNVGALPVFEERRLIGIISERDYARKVILKGASSQETMVKKIMTESLVTANPETTLKKCLDIMTRCHIRHLPILEEGELVDFISIGDLVKVLMEQRGL